MKPETGTGNRISEVRGQSCLKLSGLQHFYPGGLQSFDDDFRYAFHQFVAKGFVLLALFAQVAGEKDDGAGGLDGAGVEIPFVRREQPGPAEDVAGLDELEAAGGLAFLPVGGFEGDFAFEDDVKAVGVESFLENDFVGREFNFQGVVGKGDEVRLGKAFEKGLFGK
jgi:hypothetical protein